VHFEEDVQQWLSTTYPRRWIGCRGQIAWSPQLPDLTPHLKDLIYAVPFRTMKDLMSRLKALLTTVYANMLIHVQENAAWHSAICLEIDRGCFKHLL
jgi:hypothetical protein